MTQSIQVVDLGRMEYAAAWALQKTVVGAKRRGDFPDTLLLVEHPPVYTIGRRGGEQHLLVPRARLEAEGVAVHAVERGGDITFHGPGQLVGYPILNLKNFRPDVNVYLRQLEEVLIGTLGCFGIAAGRQPGLTGVWAGDAKLAAIGVSAHGWITMHGFALNLTTDLSYFDRIVPCGIRGQRVGSMAQWLGDAVSWAAVTDALVDCFGRRFAAEMTRVPLADLRNALDGVPDPVGLLRS